MSTTDIPSPDSPQLPESDSSSKGTSPSPKTLTNESVTSPVERTAERATPQQPTGDTGKEDGCESSLRLIPSELSAVSADSFSSQLVKKKKKKKKKAKAAPAEVAEAAVLPPTRVESAVTAAPPVHADYPNRSQHNNNNTSNNTHYPPNAYPNSNSNTNGNHYGDIHPPGFPFQNHHPHGSNNNNNRNVGPPPMPSQPFFPPPGMPDPSTFYPAMFPPPGPMNPYMMDMHAPHMLNSSAFPPPMGMPPLAPTQALLPSPALLSSTAETITPEVSPLLCCLIEREVLRYLMPSLAGLNRRRDQLQCLSQYITDSIRQCGNKAGVRYGAVRFFLFGSVNMRTVLPEGDNDITIEIDGLLPEEQCVAPSPPTGKSGVTPPLTTDSSYGNREGTLQLTTNVDGKPSLAPPVAISVTAGDLLARVKEVLEQGKTPLYVDALVLAEVRVLKLSMEGCSYDLTVSQFGGVNCVRFTHEVDAVIGGQHILKSTLLLLKAWCSYEAHILGGQGGYISSYAATIMLISMLNTVEFLEDVEEDVHSENTTESGRTNNTSSAQNVNINNPKFRTVKSGISPVMLVCRFLKFFRYFDYDQYCVTAFGPLPLTSISAAPYDLSQLEVPSAHKDASTVCEAIDKENLGLTAEGVKLMGHLVRRRQKPFLTVSGVKHLLHEMNTSRWEQREVWYASHQTGQPPARECYHPVNLSVAGNVEEDSTLTCPSCNSCAFPVRCMNVLDPLRWSSNMVRGVCRNHLQRIKRAFQEGLSMFSTASAELVSRPGVPPFSAPHSTASSMHNSDTGSTPTTFGNYNPPEELLTGYPSPLSQCTSQEVAVLQYLFDNTISTIRKNSEMNCAWRHDDDAPGLPRCPSCPHPSFFCAPDINCMCQPQCVFEDRPVSQEIRDRQRREGPLGEAVVPFTVWPTPSPFPILPT
ncbi:hypothetical protein AGDE_15700 [Angomonas deanei]|nr:hypothetical protein AGDE_15700 [Angomonas deanei]|eukprot:EPY18607.1 hypothetical protein AGDE_15700 [Angomonas deanei]